VSTEATCSACGSVYRGDAIGGLDVDQCERRGEVLHELRWCLCQRKRMGRDVARGSVAAPRPEYGANVVLVARGYSGTTGPSVFERATPTTYVAKDGEKYRRGETSYRNGQKVGATGYNIPSIPPDELARIEAWAAAQPRGKAGGA